MTGRSSVSDRRLADRRLSDQLGSMWEKLLGARISLPDDHCYASADKELATAQDALARAQNRLLSVEGGRTVNTDQR
jgi:hypothetical protein